MKNLWIKFSPEILNRLGRNRKLLETRRVPTGKSSNACDIGLDHLQPTRLPLQELSRGSSTPVFSAITDSKRIYPRLHHARECMRHGVHIVKPLRVRTADHSRALGWDRNGIITARKPPAPGRMFARLRNQPDRDRIWIKGIPCASAGVYRITIPAVTFPPVAAAPVADALLFTATVCE